MKTKAKLFKVEAQGDVMYVQAADRETAQEILFRLTGPMPPALLSWKEVDKAPAGEKILS